MPSLFIVSASPAKLAKLSAAALALASAEPIVHATLLSVESFSATDYPTAGVMLQEDGDTLTSPAVKGYIGDWVAHINDVNAYGTANPQIVSGSLAYGDTNYVGSTGNSVGVPYNITRTETDAGNSGRVYRLLDNSLKVTPSTTGVLYLSFLFQSGQQTGATTYQMLSLYNGVTSDANRTFDAGLTTNGGETGTAYNFGVDNDYISTGVAANTAVHLFVIKFKLSATAAGDSVTVWIDPIIPVSGDPVVGGTTVTGKDIAFDRLAISDYDRNSANWDEIRWGTTFADVATVSTR